MLDAHRAAADSNVRTLPPRSRGPGVPDRTRFRETSWHTRAAALRAGRLGPAHQTPAGRGFELDELYQAQLSKEWPSGQAERPVHRRLLWPLKESRPVDVVGSGARPAVRRRPESGQSTSHQREPYLQEVPVLFGVDLAKREIAKATTRPWWSRVHPDVAVHARRGGADRCRVLGTAFRRTTTCRCCPPDLDDDSFRGEVICFTFDGDGCMPEKRRSGIRGANQSSPAQTYVAVGARRHGPVASCGRPRAVVAVRDLVRPAHAASVRHPHHVTEYDLDSVDCQVTAGRARCRSSPG